MVRPQELLVSPTMAESCTAALVMPRAGAVIDAVIGTLPQGLAETCTIDGALACPVEASTTTCAVYAPCTSAVKVGLARVALFSRAALPAGAESSCHW